MRIFTLGVFFCLCACFFACGTDQDYFEKSEKTEEIGFSDLTSGSLKLSSNNGRVGNVSAGNASVGKAQAQTPCYVNYDNSPSCSRNGNDGDMRSSQHSADQSESMPVSAISWNYETQGCPSNLFFDKKYFSQKLVDLLQNTEPDCLAKEKNCNNIRKQYEGMVVEGHDIYALKTIDTAQEETVVLFTQAALALMNMLEDALDHGCFQINPEEWKGNEPLSFLYRIDELFQQDPTRQNMIFGYKPSQIMGAIALTESNAAHFKEKDGSVIVNKNKDSSATGYLQIVMEWCYTNYDNQEIFAQPVPQVEPPYGWLPSSHRYNWEQYRVDPIASCVMRGNVIKDYQKYDADNHVYHHPIMNLLGGWAINLRTLQQKRQFGSMAIQAGYAQYSGLSKYGYGPKQPIPALACGLDEVTLEEIFREIGTPVMGGNYTDVCRDRSYSKTKY